MTDIVEFLTARLDEGEAETLSSSPDGEAESWEVEQAPRISDIDVYTVDGRPICDRAQMAAAHIARHDPARVLAEVRAKRALMALHGLETLSHQPAQYELPEGFAGEFVGYCQLCSDLDYPEGLATYYEPWPCPSMRILASIYVEHPDYKQEWSVE